MKANTLVDVFVLYVYYQYLCYTFISLPVDIYQSLDLWLNRFCSSVDSAETGSKLKSVLLHKHTQFVSLCCNCR